MQRDELVARIRDGDFVTDANLDGADLSGMDLSGALLENVSFKGAKLGGARLKESFIHRCDFSGADFAGAAQYVQKIQEGWLEVDAIVATPDMMGEVGKLGRVLGPRGLMPNPKSGTVTFDVAKAVKELKAGKIEFRVDKGSNVHAPVGKASFSEDKLLENARTFLRELVRAKPAAAKGAYPRSLPISATIGPPITLDPTAVTADLVH